MTMRLKRIKFTTDLEVFSTHHLLTNSQMLIPILQVSMTFFVMPEGIGIEERLAT